MKRYNTVVACLPLVLILAGCTQDSAPAAKKEPEKPAVPVTAQYALSQMYITARSWAPDAQPIQLANIDLKDVKSVDGKAGAWECTFITARRMRSRRYTYSVVEVPPANLSKGVLGGSEDPWAPGGQTRPFNIAAVKTDAAAAYAVAMKKGADYAKKHPDMPMKFLLEATKQFADPAWRVVWGDSAATSDYSIYVDASTGEFLKIAR